jgi:hypothetical protein
MGGSWGLKLWGPSGRIETTPHGLVDRPQRPKEALRLRSPQVNSVVRGVTRAGTRSQVDESYRPLNF